MYKSNKQLIGEIISKCNEFKNRTSELDRKQLEILREQINNIIVPPKIIYIDLTKEKGASGKNEWSPAGFHKLKRAMKKTKNVL